jgi:hypothetical protein
MGTLLPLKECAWVSLRDQGARGLEDPQAVLVLGAGETQAAQTAASVARQLGGTATRVQTEATSSGPWLYRLEGVVAPER